MNIDVQWAQILTVIGANLAMIVTSIGITIALYLHTDKKIDAIAKEMSDFHGKLYAIREDASKEMRDFHDKLCSIEERQRKQ